MEEYVQVDKLFCDDLKSLTLLEFNYEIDLLKRFIEVCDAEVLKKRIEKINTYEGIVYNFAKSIVSYAKISFDNIILGHFDVSSMIDRILIENIVCMDLIINNDEIELWKYYYLHCYKKDVINLQKEKTKRRNILFHTTYQDFLEICDDLEVDNDFIKVRKNKNGKKYAYIDLDYGWTYKINKNFSFKGLCKLINSADYKFFSLASLYSHGTSLALKIGSNMTIDRIFYLITSLYVSLYRMISMYCWDCVGDEFYELSEEIEDIVNHYIDWSNDIFYKNN